MNQRADYSCAKTYSECYVIEQIVRQWAK